jgi:hypothetical protein
VYDSHGEGLRRRLRKVRSRQHSPEHRASRMRYKSRSTSSEVRLTQPPIATGYKQGHTRYGCNGYWTLTLVMDDDLLVAVADSEQGQSGHSHGWLETLSKVFISLKYLISNFPGSDQFRGPCPGVSCTSPSPRLYPSLFHSCTGFLSARAADRAIPAGS